MARIVRLFRLIRIVKLYKQALVAMDKDDERAKMLRGLKEEGGGDPEDRRFKKTDEELKELKN
jgi:hypothetical protein